MSNVISTVLLEPETLAHVRNLPFLYSEDKDIRHYSCSCVEYVGAATTHLCWYHKGMNYGIEMVRG